jgi:hypothetical protein
MKQIQPINIWVNGQEKTATLFNLFIVNDNLLNSATFCYQLLDADATTLVSNNLTMGAEDYDVWGSSADINLAAYQWAATQLNITLA